MESHCVVVDGAVVAEAELLVAGAGIHSEGRHSENHKPYKYCIP